MKSVLLIGAGVSGLTLAYRLQQLAGDLDITILEQRSRPGGNAWTDERHGFRVEAGPNGFLDNKPAKIGRASCRERV